MCRLLGTVSTTRVTLDDVLGTERGAFLGLASVHGDGWGHAWSTAAGDLEVRKSPGSALGSEELADLAAHRPAEAALTHLRWATLGLSVRPDNTHPFTDGRVAFAHNGSISPPAALDALVPGCTAGRRRGTTDSERYFLAVLARLRDGVPPGEALRDTAADIAATAEFTSLNCLLLTPESLYAFCRVDPHGPVEDDDPEYYTLRYRTAPGAVVVSSSGWGRGWSDLADGDLLVVRRRTLETFLVAREGLPAGPG